MPNKTCPQCKNELILFNGKCEICEFDPAAKIDPAPIARASREENSSDQEKEEEDEYEVATFSKKIKRGGVSCAGCAVAAIGGLLLPSIIFFPLGTALGLFGIFLIIVGLSAKNSFHCKECGNPVVETSKICPVCKLTFKP